MGNNRNTLSQGEIVSALNSSNWETPIINGVQISKEDVLQECERVGAVLAHYLELVLSWNEQVRIVGTRDFKTLLYRHALEAIICGLALRWELFHVKQGQGGAQNCAADAAKRASSDIVDIGSGAGLPGIPVALVCESARVYLVEPNSKKSMVLKELRRKLQLSNVHVVAGKFPDVRWNASAPSCVVLTKATGLDKVIIDSLASLPYSYCSALLMATPDSSASIKAASEDATLLWQECTYQIPPDMSERTFLFVSRETKSR